MHRRTSLARVARLALSLSLLLGGMARVPRSSARLAAEPGWTESAPASLSAMGGTGVSDLAMNLLEHQEDTRLPGPPAPAAIASLQGCTAPEILDVTGPEAVVTGSTNTYTATVVAPLSASLPITFTWEYVPEFVLPMVQVLNATESVVAFASVVTGTRPITVTAENCGGSVTTVGEVVVEEAPLPDLVVTDVWDELGIVHFQIQNVGLATAPSGHEVYLQVDGAAKAPFPVTQDLAPGERLDAYFLSHGGCSGLEDVIRVSADGGDVLVEEDEGNNDRQETWLCDTVAPQITYGPTATVLSASSAAIEWGTDENADSRVEYGMSAGEAYDAFAFEGALTVTHNITLTGLSSGVYHYMVASADGSGNQVQSGDHFFEILPPAESPSVLDVIGQRKDTANPIYRFKSQVPSASMIDRLEFFVDDELFGIDYSGWPDLSHGTSEYHFDLTPHLQLLDRAGFFGDHEVEVVAYDYQGLLDGLTTDFTPVFEAMIVELQILSPQTGDAIAYTQQAYLPDPTNVEISVQALAYDWSCALQTGRDGEPIPDAPPICGDTDVLLSSLDIYIYDEWNYLRHTDSFVPGLGEEMVWHTFTWNAEGMWPGSYRIRLEAAAGDGSTHGVEEVVQVVYGAPSLQLSRNVILEPDKPYATVELTLWNDAEADDTVYVDILKDWIQELQPVESDMPEYSVRTVYNAPTRVNRLDVSFHSPASGGTGSEPLALAPGEEVVIEYLAVPILYPDGPAALKMGVVDVKVEYAYAIGGTTFSQSFERSQTLTTYQADELTGAADYVLATNPVRLQAMPNNVGSDALLASMAKLATLRQGVLGYLEDYEDSDHVLDGLVEVWGYWASALHIYDQLFPRFYLLIVGETEIVPAWTDEFEVTDDAEWEEKDWELVERSDQPYSMHPVGWSFGEYPQIRVGRIVGNDPDALLQPLLASIAIAEGTGGLEFDRSHAFLISGEGEAQELHRDSNNLLRGNLLYEGVDVTSVYGLDHYLAGHFPVVYDTGDKLACGDVDGDGFDEIVIADASQDRLYIYRSDGTELGSFQPSSIFGSPMSVDQQHSIAVGDVTGGSEAEIIFNDWSFLYLYDQAGLLQMPPVNVSGRSPFAIAVGDADGDGQKEIVLGSASCGGSGCVYGLDATGTQLYQISHNYYYFDHLAVGDIISGMPGAEGDEIIVADQSENRIYLYGWLGVVLGQQAWQVDAFDLLAAGNVALLVAGDEVVYGRPSENTVFVLGWSETASELRIDHRIYLDMFVEHNGLAAGNVRGASYDEVVIGDRLDQVLITDDFYCGRIENEVQDSGGLVNHDVILYFGHGWPNNWSCSLSTDLPIAGFGSAAPVVLATSCLTGDYEGTGDDGIAEHILGSGSAVYVGATQVSIVEDNGPAGRRFFELWDDSDSAGDAHFSLELEKWDNGAQQNLFFVYEYNLYGDPKFGVTAPAGGSGLGAVSAQAGSTLLHVDVPTYTVTQVGGFDRVEIPDGGMLVQAGDPVVPYWPVTINYPEGEVVQNVLLVDHSEPLTDTNLVLPYPNLGHAAANDGNRGRPDVRAANGVGEDRWVPDPAVPFEWGTWDNPDGSSTLLLDVYPMFYQPSRAALEFYRHFTFTVETISTTVSVERLVTDLGVYPAWGDVLASLWLDNTGERQDVIVSAVVRRAFTGELVEGLPLRVLHQLVGRGWYDMAWDSSGAAPGRYFLEVELLDTEGRLLDQAAVGFELGETAAEVSSLTATPTSFLPGDTVAVSMTVLNTGTQAITGTAVIVVQTCDDGTVVESFNHAVNNLAPDGTLSFQDVWDTTGAEECCYEILGYLMYDSKTTEIATVTVERVGAQASLELTKSDSSDPLPATWWAHYAIQVSNQGTGPSGEVLLQDTIPAGMYFLQTPANEGWAHVGGTVSRKVTNLDPGASVSFPLLLGTHSSVRGTLTNTVTAAWACSVVTATEATTVVGRLPPPSCPDPYEPNETLGKAWSLSPGSYWSYICCSDPADDDYFRFIADLGDEIELRLSELPDNYELCLLGPDGAELTCSTNPTTTAEHILQVAAEDGEHYARVYGFERRACSSTVPYRLEIAVTGAAPTETPTATPTSTPTATPTATGTVATPTTTATPTGTTVPAQVLHQAYLPVVIKNRP